MLSPAELARDLSVRDLTDPTAGPHAVQTLVVALTAALTRRWPSTTAQVVRARPVVPVEDNYDALGYDDAAVTRDARYTRYVSERCVLRSHTSAIVPPVLRRLATSPGPVDALLVCPGIVYRRDAIDRIHTGTPHQVDLWRVARRPPGSPGLDGDDLEEMIAAVVEAVLPGRRWRCTPAVHPYTLAGRQVDVADGARWIEVGECGLAHPDVLARAGLDDGGWSGLAMGLGLDRLLMIRKGIDDIRLLRSEDPRAARQLLDLERWVPLSNQPAVRRDVSIAVAHDADEELLGDAVRSALGADATAVEAVTLLSETAAADIPAPAASRLGLRRDQKNVVLRLVLRHPERTLTSAEANVLRDRVALALHAGDEQPLLAAG